MPTVHSSCTFAQAVAHPAGAGPAAQHVHPEPPPGAAHRAPGVPAGADLWVNGGLDGTRHKLAKRLSKHSVSRAPEAMVARMLLDNMAVEALGREPGMRSFHQWMPACSTAELQGADHNSRDEQSGCLLLYKVILCCSTTCGLCRASSQRQRRPAGRARR